MNKTNISKCTLIYEDIFFSISKVDCYDEEEDGDMSATSRPDSMTDATTDNLNEVNFPNYFRNQDSYNAPSVNNATKKSFK